MRPHFRRSSLSVATFMLLALARGLARDISVKLIGPEEEPAALASLSLIVLNLTEQQAGAIVEPLPVEKGRCMPSDGRYVEKEVMVPVETLFCHFSSLR